MRMLPAGEAIKPESAIPVLKLVLLLGRESEAITVVPSQSLQPLSGVEHYKRWRNLHRNDTLRARSVDSRRPCVAHPWRHRRKSRTLHSKLSVERHICRTGCARRFAELLHLRLCHQWRRHLRRLPPDQRSRSLGSRASRSASPNRLKPKTVSAIARPGKTAIHGAVEAYSSAPPCNIRPHAAVGSCTPSPR